MMRSHWLPGRAFIARSRTFLVGGLALLALVLASMPAAAQSIAFRFNPPSGTTFLLTRTLTRTQDGGPAGKQSENMEAKTRITIKKTAGGFSMTFTPVSTTTTVNGKKIQVSDADGKGPGLTYDLDKQGKLLSIRGFEALKKNIDKQVADYNQQHPEKKLPADTAQKSYDAQVRAMTEQRKEEWQDQFGRFLGKTVKVGDAWKQTITVPMEFGGSAPLHMVTKFAGMAKRGGHNCVRITQTTTADPKEVKAAVDAVYAALQKQAAAQKKTLDLPKVVSLTSNGTSDRYMDPATMLVYAESATQTTTAKLDVPGKGQRTITTVETQAFTFQYGK